MHENPHKPHSVPRLPISKSQRSRFLGRTQRPQAGTTARPHLRGKERLLSTACMGAGPCSSFGQRLFCSQSGCVWAVRSAPLGIPGDRAFVPKELTLPGNSQPPRKSSWPRHTRYRHAYLPAEAIKTFENFNVTTPARTVIDVARWHGFHVGLAVADGYLRRGGTIASLKHEVQRIGRAKGSAVARKVIDCASSKSESAAESWARAQIIEASLPFTMMELQKEIQAQGNDYFVDIVIDDWLIIEVDGDQKYLGATTEIQPPLYSPNSNAKSASKTWDTNSCASIGTCSATISSSPSSTNTSRSLLDA